MQIDRVVGVLLALSLLACSGDDEPNPTTVPEPHVTDISQDTATPDATSSENAPDASRPEPPSITAPPDLGARVITTDGHSGQGLQLGWNYADDGELVATGDANPYLLSDFVHDPEFLKAEYEDKLTEAAAQGFAIVPISHYLAILEDRDIPPTPIDPPVLDGTWQPKASDNMHLWMGGAGQVPGLERDHQILTANVQLRRHLALVEQRLQGADQITDFDQDTQPAWASFRHAVRELLLAEVSDSTGWRPVGTEIDYSLRHQANAQAVVDELMVWLDHHTGTWTARPDAELTPRDAPPAALKDIVVTTTRDHEVRWLDGPDFVVLELTLKGDDGISGDTEFPPEVRLDVPMQTDRLHYSPALLHESVLDEALADYAWPTATAEYNVNGLPLPNGLLGIAPDWTLVLDQRTVHLTAMVGTDKVSFVDQTAPANEPGQWRIRFYNLTAQDALAHANALNVDAPARAE
ncbi:MAG: hypothetical protein ACI9WU_000820 [Myxococcota bacterium]|jgi:hypothetical protein